ncbi:hypothetical protein F511_19068, partial [Dorcoceras hygrometricum]
FMDNTEPGNFVAEDMTRESLIAISYRVPDKDPTAEELPKRVKGENVDETPCPDIDEKYRSKLISISYSPPTNVKVLPILPGKLEGYCLES